MFRQLVLANHPGPAKFGEQLIAQPGRWSRETFGHGQQTLMVVRADNQRG